MPRNVAHEELYDIFMIIDECYDVTVNQVFQIVAKPKVVWLSLTMGHIKQ